MKTGRQMTKWLLDLKIEENQTKSREFVIKMRSPIFYLLLFYVSFFTWVAFQTAEEIMGNHFTLIPKNFLARRHKL